MTCDQATFALERRWDHALSGEEERALDDHIGACATCRAEAEAIAMADAVFLRLPDMDPPVNLAAAVAQQIAQEAPAEPRRGWFWGSVAVLAAVLAGLFSLGITPAALWNAPVIAAVFAPAAHAVSDWLRPVTLPLEALSPAIGSLAPWAGAIAVAEIGAIGMWVARRHNGRHVAGRV